MNILIPFDILILICSVCSLDLFAEQARKEEDESLSALLQLLQDGKNKKDASVGSDASAKIYYLYYYKPLLQLLRIASGEAPDEHRRDNERRESPRRPIALEERGRQRFAIDILGHIRAIEAVPFLITNITLATDTTPSSSERFSNLPCVQALVRINKPASLASVAELPKAAGDEKRTRMLLTVIKAVEGPEVGAFMLKRAMEMANEKETKDAYAKALTVFEDIKE